VLHYWIWKYSPRC